MQNTLRDLSEIELPWLEQLAPHYYEFDSDLPVALRRKEMNDASRSGMSNIAEGRLANIN